MVYFYPKDDEIRKVMDRLTVKDSTRVKSKIATNLSKYSTIKYLRKKDFIAIAKDHRKNRSIIQIEGTKVFKKGKKYFFDGL